MRKCAKSWENVQKVEKMCQKLRKCAKSWESMRKCEKVWESVRKCAKSWENVEKAENVCQKLRKCEKVWESMRKYENVRNLLMKAFSKSRIHLFLFFFGGGVKVSPSTTFCCQKCLLKCFSLQNGLMKAHFL